MKAATTAIFGCLFTIILTTAIDLFTAWILWLIYNAIAPSFHWPLVAYWTMFYIVVGLSIIASFFKPSTSSSKK